MLFDYCMSLMCNATEAFLIFYYLVTTIYVVVFMLDSVITLFEKERVGRCADRLVV